MRRDELAIFKPQKLGNSPSAGGQRTSQKVVSGKLNEVFDGISAVGYGQGAIELAKVYPGVASANTELLKSAHVYFSESPLDPQVSMLIVESEIDDADLLDTMKASLQVGRKVGDLVGDLDAAVAGQDRINSKLIVKAGDIVAITIEYTGANDTTFPKSTHFAQVTEIIAEQYASGMRQVGFFITPALPFALPSATLAINGQKPCAKLRRTTYDSSMVKYHGTTKLTSAAASGATTLAVQSTRAAVLPALTALKNYSGLGQDASNVELVRKVQQLNAQSSQTYLFPETDIFTTVQAGIDPTVYIGYVVNGSLIVEPTAYSISASGVSVSLRTRPDAGTKVLLSYLSSARYAVINSNPFSLPVNSRIIPGTVQGTVAKSDDSATVNDEAGQLMYTKVVNGLSERVSAGTVDYATGTVVLSSPWTGRTLTALTGTIAQPTTIQFLLPYPDVIPSTLYVSAKTAANVLLTGSGSSNGSITGANVSGTIINGLVSLTFNTAVDDSTIRLDFSESTRLLPPAELYGVNPVQMPDGGTTDVFHKWGLVVVSDTQSQSLLTPTVGQTINARTNAFIAVRGADGSDLWSFTDEYYSYNKTNGQITINSLTGVSLPLIITDTKSELAMVKSVSTNQLTLTSGLTGSYPIGCVVSSVSVLGDLQATVSNVRDATAWDGDFDLVGTPSSANLNTVDYPIQVTNNAAINERWALKFDSSSAFKCYGKGVGMIAQGSTLQAFSPVNPSTNQPYFTIPQQAFGAGWSAGEVILFTTIAAAKPLLLMRCVSPGHSALDQDSMTLMFAGNA